MRRSFIYRVSQIKEISTRKNVFEAIENVFVKHMKMEQEVEVRII